MTTDVDAFPTAEEIVLLDRPRTPEEYAWWLVTSGIEESVEEDPNSEDWVDDDGHEEACEIAHGILDVLSEDRELRAAILRRVRANRVAPAAQPRMVTYVVVKVRIVGPPDKPIWTYAHPLGTEYASREVALTEGIAELGSDDFSIATLHDGQLVAFGHDMQDWKPGEENLPDIARQLGWQVHPDAPRPIAPPKETHA